MSYGPFLDLKNTVFLGQVLCLGPLFVVNR